jgi:adenosylhomocysteine nucleosidase
MKRVPAIIAALPREVAALVAGWKHHSPANNIRIYTNGDAVVAYAGMGAARVALAVKAAMDAMPITDLISVGLAGACDPRLRAGEIIRAGLGLDSQGVEQFADLQFRQVLVSADSVASLQEKTRLYTTYFAHAVDMEAGAVARLARENGLQFHALKAISDEADFELPDFARFSTNDGQFSEGAFALYAALHPRMWSKAITLGRNSGKALRALTEALRGELDWYKKNA